MKKTINDQKLRFSIANVKLPEGNVNSFHETQRPWHSSSLSQNRKPWRQGQKMSFSKNSYGLTSLDIARNLSVKSLCNRFENQRCLRTILSISLGNIIKLARIWGSTRVRFITSLHSPFLQTKLPSPPVRSMMDRHLTLTEFRFSGHPCDGAMAKTSKSSKVSCGTLDPLWVTKKNCYERKIGTIEIHVISYVII